jgi:hypothetical protein
MSAGLTRRREDPELHGQPVRHPLNVERKHILAVPPLFAGVRFKTPLEPAEIGVPFTRDLVAEPNGSDGLEQPCVEDGVECSLVPEPLAVIALHLHGYKCKVGARLESGVITRRS